MPAGDICVLVGPSGGGKTTAMKMVNRLITITEGDIMIDGRGVRALDLIELRRGIGYVIQQIGLFPHLTIAGQRRHRAAAARLEQGAIREPRRRAARARRARPRRATATATRRSSPAASASASAWPGRWPPTRR